MISGPGSIDSITGDYIAGIETGIASIEISDQLGNILLATADNIPFPTNGRVDVQAFDASGNQYIAGDFTAIYPQSASKMVKLNSITGKIELGFDLQRGFDGPINAVVSLPDGSVIVGGDFEFYNGISRPYIAKIKSNGALDLTFDTRSGFDDEVHTLQLVGSDIYVGGDFGEYKDIDGNGIAKLNANTGELDSSFVSGVSTRGIVYSLQVVEDALYIGGRFTAYGGEARQNIAKLNANTGALDLDFDSASGFDDRVYTLQVIGNDLYVGGEFDAYGDADREHLAKLNANTGALDSVFNSVSGFNSTVHNLQVVGDNIYVGGDFSRYKSSSHDGIAKLNRENAAVDSGFNFETEDGFNATVFDFQVVGSAIYVVGDFDRYQDIDREGIAKIDATTGALDLDFDARAGFNDEVNSLHVVGTDIFVGGEFNAYGGILRQKIAKLDATTEAVDLDFDSSFGFGCRVSSLQIIGSAIYAGGSFGSYGGSTIDSIAKLDAETGVLDSGFTTGTGFNGNVYAFQVLGDYIYVGGTFTTYRNTTRQKIAKLDSTNGELILDFNSSSGFDNTVNTLQVIGDDLYVGGRFTTYGGEPRQRIAKLNAITGALDIGFDSSSGFDNTVRSLQVMGNDLYVGGDFAIYNGENRYRLAKLDASNGILDSVFDSSSPFNRTVYSMHVVGNYIYIGGGFQSWGGVDRYGLAKLDAINGAVDLEFDTSESGLYRNVLDLKVVGTEVRVVINFETDRYGSRLSLAKFDSLNGNSIGDRQKEPDYELK